MGHVHWEEVVCACFFGCTKKKELEKFKAIEEINALKASGSIDDRTYATRYLTATMPGFTSLAPNLLETEVENFKGKTAPYTLQGNIDEINKNAALESTMINDLTAKAIKDAKGNSFLINKILNKKQELESDILKDIESKQCQYFVNEPSLEIRVCRQS